MVSRLSLPGAEAALRAQGEARAVTAFEEVKCSGEAAEAGSS